MTSSRAAAAWASAVAIALLALGCDNPPPPTADASLGSVPTAAAPTPASPSPTPAPVPPSPTAAASPAPTASPAATATPAPTPEPGGPDAVAYRTDAEIADVEFAPDGRIVFAERAWGADAARIMVLDARGEPVPGWPWNPGDTGDPIAEVELGPGGSVYAAVRTRTTDPLTWSWALHRLDAGAREMPGFPVTVADESFCELAVTPDGDALTTCEDEDEATGRTVAVVGRIRPDGSMAAGWPVRLRTTGQVAGVRPDGAVVVAGGSPRRASITVLRPDGRTVRGWPRPIPFEASVLVDGRGRVHVTATDFEEGQCGAPIRTRLTVLRRDGTTAPGWPVTIPGWASPPMLGPDGAATVFTGAGRAIRYGPDGRVLSGWPVRDVPVVVGCSRGNAPAGAGRGAVVAVGGREAMLIRANGSVAPGWPVTLPSTAAYICPGCTPGPDAALPPAIGGRGIWVATYRGDRPRVIGIARDGTMPASWRRTVGQAGDEIAWVRIAADGRVWVLVHRWNNASESEIGILVPVADDRPPAP